MGRTLSELSLDQAPRAIQLCLISGVYMRALEPEMRTNWHDANYAWGLPGYTCIGLYWKAMIAWGFSRMAIPWTVKVAERAEILLHRDGNHVAAYRRRFKRLLWSVNFPVELQLQWRAELADFEVMSHTRRFVCLMVGDKTVWLPKLEAAILQEWLAGSNG